MAYDPVFQGWISQYPVQYGMQGLLVGSHANIPFKIDDFRIIGNTQTGGFTDETENLLNRQARIPDDDSLIDQGILTSDQSGQQKKENNENPLERTGREERKKSLNLTG
jgi:hypothetical protein